MKSLIPYQYFKPATNAICAAQPYSFPYKKSSVLTHRAPQNVGNPKFTLKAVKNGPKRAMSTT